MPVRAKPGAGRYRINDSKTTVSGVACLVRSRLTRHAYQAINLTLDIQTSQWSYPAIPAASSRVSWAAGIALHPLAFWPHQSGEKSPEP